MEEENGGGGRRKKERSRGQPDGECAGRAGACWTGGVNAIAEGGLKAVRVARGAETRRCHGMCPSREGDFSDCARFSDTGSARVMSLCRTMRRARVHFYKKK